MLTAIGMALIACGIIWLRSSTAAGFLTNAGYSKYMRGLGVLCICAGIGFVILNLARPKANVNASYAASVVQSDDWKQIDLIMNKFGHKPLSESDFLIFRQAVALQSNTNRLSGIAKTLESARMSNSIRNDAEMRCMTLPLDEPDRCSFSKGDEFMLDLLERDGGISPAFRIETLKNLLALKKRHVKPLTPAQIADATRHIAAVDHEYARLIEILNSTVAERTRQRLTNEAVKKSEIRCDSESADLF